MVVAVVMFCDGDVWGGNERVDNHTKKVDVLAFVCVDITVFFQILAIIILMIRIIIIMIIL